MLLSFAPEHRKLQTELLRRVRSADMMVCSGGEENELMIYA